MKSQKLELKPGNEASPRRSARTRRVTVSIPEPLYLDLENWADERGDSMSGLLRWCLAAGKVISDNTEAGSKIYIGKEDGNVTRELVFSRYV